MSLSPSMFSGFPIRISEHLPTTKTVTVRNERKWCHWQGDAARRYRLTLKQVPCETVFMFGGMIVMSSNTHSKLKLEMEKNGVCN